MTETSLDVDPAELIATASNLDRLAGRIETSLARVATTHPANSAARDEVSATTAASFDAVGDRMQTDCASAVRELRKIAATLRAQAHGFNRADADAAEALRT